MQKIDGSGRREERNSGKRGKKDRQITVCLQLTVKFAQQKISCVQLLQTSPTRAHAGHCLTRKCMLQPACIQPCPLLPHPAMGTPPQATLQTGALTRYCTAPLTPPPPRMGISAPPVSHARGIDSKITCSCLSLNGAAILLEEWPTITQFSQADGNWPEEYSENITEGSLTTLC